MDKTREPIVKVTEGELLGNIKTNINNEQFYSFQGVPYAKPPLGKLRFKAPQPPEKWEGSRKAKKDENPCYAKHFNEYSGSEDCLYLNVFTKEITGKILKPVMVWIHGGAFTKGSNSTTIYGPEYIMIEDVVLVTLNYRLGPLGFLSLENSSLEVSGNAGLKDIVMALKWVQRNIQSFCGDSNNITIFGESAGGAAVHLLMLSPMSKGLFHKAISQSGCASNGWVQSKIHGTYQLAEVLGIQSNNEEIILKHLQDMSVEELVKGLDVISDPFYIGKLRPFTPTIEKPTSRSTFLSEDPVYLLKSRKYHKVPFMSGCCSKEGMFVYALCTGGRTSHLLKDETIVPFNLHLRKGTDRYDKAKREIIQYYFGNTDPLSNIENIYKLYTDNYFLLEVYRAAKYHALSSTMPVYFYNFALDTELNIMKNLYSIAERGACHADDIGYLFKNELTDDLKSNTIEDIAVRRLVRLWTNFAKYGNPTPGQDDSLLNDVKWHPITKDKFNVLNIDTDLQMLNDHPEATALNFWQNLYNKYEIISKL